MNMSRLLIVEDNVALRNMLSELLDVPGVEILTAGAADEALHLMSARPVDAVLADVELPGMSGIELCRWIRRQTAIAVWLMTGSHDETIQQDAQVAGANEVIQKPFSVPAMARRIEQAIGRPLTAVSA